MIACAAKLFIRRSALIEIDEMSIEGSQGGPAHEICGFLVGHVEADHYHVSFSLGVANSAASEAPNRYRIDAEAYIEAEQLLKLRGLQIVGVFHDHPGADAEPSQLDRDYFFPGLVYLIVGRPAVGEIEHRAFQRLISDPHVIIEIGIQVIEDDNPS
jgi:proteasome lid subunit RPN8/RPN11